MSRESKPRTGKQQADERRKLSLYPLSIEDALRAALQTGKAPPLKKARTNRQRKKPAIPD